MHGLETEEGSEAQLKITDKLTNHTPNFALSFTSSPIPKSIYCKCQCTFLTALGIAKHSHSNTLSPELSLDVHEMLEFTYSSRSPTKTRVVHLFPSHIVTYSATFESHPGPQKDEPFSGEHLLDFS